MRRRIKACIFLLVICIQFVLLGCNVGGTNFFINNKPEVPDMKMHQKEGASYSSPYYFPVNKSTPLMTEELSEVETDQSPKLVSNYYYYYNDYALTLNLDKYVLIVGEILTINLGLTCNLTASAGNIISVEVYQGFYRDYYFYYPNYYETATPIFTINLTTNANGLVSIPFTMTSTEGIYTVYAYTENCRAYKEFTIGEVGIFYKGPRYYKQNQLYTAAVHIVNLTDFSGIPLAGFNYSVSYYDYSSTSWIFLTTNEGQTDDSGYAIFTTDIPLDIDDYYILRLTIQTIDGKAEYQTFLYESWDYYYYCMWGGQQKTIQERFQYVVTTDKTIYSPGDTIFLRVLVLEYSFMNETKKAMQNTPVSLTIYNPNEFAVFWSTITTDDYGILTFTFPLDEDCELGYYGFEFSQSNKKYRYNIKVEYYVKPVFRVDIDTNGKEFYPTYENLFEGFIEATYYFGQPVVGASVELTIQNYWGELKFKLEGITNSEGRLYFSINLQYIPDIDYTFSVLTNVIDIYGRSASIEKIYTRIEQLFAYGYLTNWAPNPTETLEYYFYVFQYIMSGDEYYYWHWMYNPLANVTANIEIFGIVGYPMYTSLISDKKLLATYSESTNKFGAGKLEFKLPLGQIIPYDLFEIRLSVTLKDGRSTASSYYFRYKKYSLDINIIDSNLDLGETLEFEVTFKNVLTGSPSTGEGRIYIYDAKCQLIGRVSDMISGSKTYNFYIPSFYPEGKYYIYSYVYSRSNEYYGGFSYHSAHDFFVVGSFYSVSFVTNYTNTGTYYDQIEVQINDVIEINGISNVSSNIPLYIEVYKRGLLFSVPLEVIDDKFSYNLSVKADFAPDFTIIIYTISDLGKLYESILAVHIDFSYTLSLSTDKEIYEPGDLITLTITPSDNITSVLSLSFIDSAVLDVEPEDDSELAYFTMNTYSTYIRSGSSWGSGFMFDSYWWCGYGIPTGGVYYRENEEPVPLLDDFYAFPYGENGHFKRDTPSFDDLLSTLDTEIRKNISESANWMPKLIISEQTNITFKLTDNIGEWTIRTVGNSMIGDFNDLVLWGDVETIQIKSFLPFFIEFDIPQPVGQDDILDVKGYIYNYIGTDVYALVAINAPELAILNKDTQELFIPNGFISEVEFSVYCIEPYFQNITLLAVTEVSGIQYSDAKQITTYIKPNGIEVINRTIGFLNATDGSLLLNYTVDPLAIYHKETLALYTDLMDISIESWQSLIGYPYGCIEQTISRTLPTALIFNYLKQTGQLTTNLEQELTSMILEGLNRIYNFQHSDGGWGWWRDDTSKILMTSIVVSALIQIEEVGFQINSITLKRGIEYLINHQYPNGLWDFQEYSSNTLEATAFILKAIMNFNNKTSQMDTAISKAVNEFRSLWNTEEMQSAYAASLFYIATRDNIYENTTFNDILIQFIKDNKKIEENTIFWDSDVNNIWYWRKLGNIVEITSYAVWALALDDYVNNYALIKKAVRYLLNQHNRWGWGSTADTAAAITALTAIKGIILTGGFIDFNGTVSVMINNHKPPQYVLNFTESNNNPDEILLNLREYITENTNTINISLNGSGQICYIFESVQILRSNPKIEIPAMIEVSKNEQFYVGVRFSKIDDRMPIFDATSSLLHIPQNFQDPEANYTIFTPILINGSEIFFSLIAPNIEGDYILEGVSVLGFIQFNDTSNNSSSYQIFQRTVGPIIIRVGTQPPSSYPLIETIHSSAAEDSELLTLTKQVSKQEFLVPGEIITITIKISNNGDPRQFYVLEDKQPTGTIFLSDSVKILGDYNNSEITHGLFLSGIHFFFPMLAIGITEITYQLQVDNIKNSYSGECKLWGMYDDFCISAYSIVLENIPRKHSPDNSIYQDLLLPYILNISFSQKFKEPKIQLQINLQATDNNGINRIRVVFSQNSGWRVQTLYSMKNQEDFLIIITDIKNINSIVKMYLEVSDIYGNIATTNLIPVKIFAYEIIPYLIIGVILGLSIGLASISSILYKKYEEKKQREQDRIINKTKHEISKVSFLDESEEEMKK